MAIDPQELPSPALRWLDHLAQQGKADSTIRSYTADLRDFVRWYGDRSGGILDIGSVAPQHIEAYKTFLQQVRQVSARTINRRLAALSRFFKWAAGRERVHCDPTAEVRTLRVPPRRPRALTPLEESHFRQAVYRSGKVRDIAIVELLLGTGIRLGELLELRCGDLLFQPRSGWLLLRRSRPSRRLPLRASLCQALQVYLDSLGRELDDDDPLWWGTRGPLRSPSGINRMLEKYALRVGIDPLTPHTLRHTFAIRYLEANPQDLRGLATLLGHSSLDAVMRYVGPAEESLLERLERMGQPLASQAEPVEPWGEVVPLAGPGHGSFLEKDLPGKAGSP